MVGLETDNELFDEAVAMIKNDALRIFNIDIETDSTIAADEEKEKQGLAEAMTAISTFIGATFPLVQTGALPMPVAMGLLTDYLRKFRFGRKLDDLLQELAQAPAPPNPEEQAKKAEQEEKQQEMQAKQAEVQLKLQEKQATMELTIKAMQAKLGMDEEVHQQELRQDEEVHDQEMRQSEETHGEDLSNKKELASVQRQQTTSNVQ